MEYLVELSNWSERTVLTSESWKGMCWIGWILPNMLELSLISILMWCVLHLEIRFSKLSSRGLILISKGCLNLECLDVSGCANVTSRNMATGVCMMTGFKLLPRTWLKSRKPGKYRYQLSGNINIRITGLFQAWAVQVSHVMVSAVIIDKYVHATCV